MEQSEIAAALREAIDRHLLLAGDDEVMHFRHGLLREVVYEELLPGSGWRSMPRLPQRSRRSIRLRYRRRGGLRAGAPLVRGKGCAPSTARPPARRTAAERMFAFGNAFAHYHLALGLWPTATETVGGLTRQSSRCVPPRQPP